LPLASANGKEEIEFDKGFSPMFFGRIIIRQLADHDPQQGGLTSQKPCSAGAELWSFLFPSLPTASC